MSKRPYGHEQMPKAGRIPSSAGGLLRQAMPTAAPAAMPRPLPKRLQVAGALAVLIAATFLVGLPIQAITTYREPATSAAVIQAGTSWAGTLLAFIASVVAVAAYRNSTLRPAIEIDLRFSSSALLLTVVNFGDVVAHHCFVRLGTDGTAWLVAPAGWSAVETDGVIAALQWEDQARIHPNLGHDLPPIPLPPGTTRVAVSYACEGQRPEYQSFVIA